MKTINQLQHEIMMLRGLHLPNEVSKEANKDRKRAAFIRLCINYLEANPDEALLKAQHNRLLKDIKIKKSRCDTWIKNNYPKAFDDETTLKKAKKRYNSMFEINKLEKQLKTINYLLI